MASGIHDGVRNMTVDDFRQSLTAPKPPAELTLALIGLWWDAAKVTGRGLTNQLEGRRPRGFVGARRPASQGSR